MDWWEAVNLGASIVTCLSFVAAVWTWNRNRSRVMNAHLDVAFAGDWNVKDQWGETIGCGRVLRVQNIGGAGMCLHYLWMKNFELTYKPYKEAGEKPPSAVIMPGESITLYTSEMPGENAELVVQYNTHMDARIIHYDRFTLDDLSLETFLIGAEANPTIRARIQRRYDGQALFNDRGISTCRRTIKLTSGSKRQETRVRSAANWLIGAGFRATNLGEYPTRSDDEDAQAGDPDHA